MYIHGQYGFRLVGRYFVEESGITIGLSHVIDEYADIVVVSRQLFRHASTRTVVQLGVIADYLLGLFDALIILRIDLIRDVFEFGFGAGD